MGGYERQHLRTPNEVLHELTGKLYRVPGYAVDSGDAGVGHARQHVVQTVAEFMKQRGYLVMRQQRGSAAYRRREIAYQLGDGKGCSRGQGFGDDALVHPGTAALLGARIRIQEESRHAPLVLIE